MMNTAELKRKLRDLRKIEKRVRFSGFYAEREKDYVWNRFFSTKSMHDMEVKYSLGYLLGTDHAARKEIFEEFFFHVYAAVLQQTGALSFDPRLLSELGLSPVAGLDEIKKRFRELARKHHPDVGGDHNRMVHILDTYKKLVNKDKFL